MTGSDASGSESSGATFGGVTYNKAMTEYAMETIVQFIISQKLAMDDGKDAINWAKVQHGASHAECPLLTQLMENYMFTTLIEEPMTAIQLAVLQNDKPRLIELLDECDPEDEVETPLP